MKKLIFVFIAVFSVALYFGVKFFWKIPKDVPIAFASKVWPTQSIDTVKYSRDLAREKLNDPTFDVQIDKQVSDIAATGATHVAIATPYDEEFYSFLKRWVDSARKHKISVWFRGNLSGWEQWFNYPKISASDHTTQTVAFVLKHPELFQDGDIFTSCPECENGGTGDPRTTGDVVGFRTFLINENTQLIAAFSKIRKNVVSGYYSMNGDVASLVMDPDTTKALGGVVTVDHYVSTPERLIEYIDNVATTSGGKVVLGEWGAPIPDINGQMTDESQFVWITRALSLLSNDKNVVGLNYWTNLGGSTAIWNDDGTARQAVTAMTSFYTPREISGTITNEVGNAIYDASVITSLSNVSVHADYGGRFRIQVLPDDNTVTINGAGYSTKTISVTNEDAYSVTLTKEHENIFFKFAKWINTKLL